MIEQFEDIIVTRFHAGPEDQEPEHKAVFHFKFFLSRPAPSLWVDVARADLGETTGRVNFCVQRRAWASTNYIVVRCTADEAQKVKDALNTQVLPAVNSEYRRHALSAQMRVEQQQHEQNKILSAVESAVANQK